MKNQKDLKPTEEGALGYEGGVARRPYHPPRLLTYGDFRQLTRSAAGGTEASGSEEASLGRPTSS
jgi:hypothetical protein